MLLQKSVARGESPCLLGSTAKMGEGTNAQTRLVACIISTRPGDLRYRAARKAEILRPRQQNEYVKIFRYVTEGSFDAYMWQRLKRSAAS